VQGPGAHGISRVNNPDRPQHAPDDVGAADELTLRQVDTRADRADPTSARAPERRSTRRSLTPEALVQP